MEAESQELVARLRSQLQSAKDPSSQADAVLHAVDALASGSDLSPLCRDMLQAYASGDAKTKKLALMFFQQHVQEDESFALLLVNSLQKDSRSPNPLLRAVAARELASFIRHGGGAKDLAVPLLTTALRDPNEYVRMAAVSGAQTLCETSPDALDSLEGMLSAAERDSSTAVAMRAVRALAAVSDSPPPDGVIDSLVGRILECADCDKPLVMQLAKESGAMRRMPGLLGTITQLVHSADAEVSLSACALLLCAEGDRGTSTEISESTLALIRDVLLAWTAWAPTEVQTKALALLQVLASAHPDQLKPRVTDLFPRVTDALSVKEEKLRLLEMLLDSHNASLILTAYTLQLADGDAAAALQAIRALSKAALASVEAAPACLQLLIEEMWRRRPGITVRAAEAYRDVLVRYPGLASEFLPQALELFEACEDPEARLQWLWLAGSFGEGQPVSDFLERCAYEVSWWPCPALRRELVNATFKQFIRRPEECRLALGEVVRFALEEERDITVRDAGLFVYRMLLLNSPETWRECYGGHDIGTAAKEEEAKPQQSTQDGLAERLWEACFGSG